MGAFYKAEINLIVSPDILRLAAEQLTQRGPGQDGKPGPNFQRVLLDLPGVRVTLLNPASPDVREYHAREYRQNLPAPAGQIVQAAAGAVDELKRGLPAFGAPRSDKPQ